MERRTVSARSYSGATIAERPLPADEFVLSHTLDTLGNADFEIERLVARDSEEVMPCVGTTGVDADELESALAEDPSVDEIERIVRPDEAVSDRMHWIESIETLSTSSSRRGRSSSPRATVRAGSCASCFPTGTRFREPTTSASRTPSRSAFGASTISSRRDAAFEVPAGNERRTVFEPVRVLK